MKAYTVLQEKDREIIDYIKDASLFSQFNKKNWIEMSVPEKVAILREVELFLSTYQGRKCQQIELASKLSVRRFRDDSNSGVIRFNNNAVIFLNANLIHKRTIMLETIIYLGQHKHHYDLIMGNIPSDGYDEDTINLWKENSPDDCNHIPSESVMSFHDSLLYWGQPTVNDALYYELMVMDTINKYFELDFKYSCELARKKLKFEFYRQLAIKLYGSKYQRNILEQIKIKRKFLI